MKVRRPHPTEGADASTCLARRWAPIFALAVLAGPLAAGASGAVQSPAPAVTRADPVAFRGDGMWIWYVSEASGGTPQRIAARARSRGIETVFIKAADGTHAWSQFTPELVAALRSRGLKVCAWHYVYGASPKGEARVSAEVVGHGADCLVIDAESQYEGRYAQASVYISKLRAAVGETYPLGLAGFPYVHYHPAFPYSVFLGPGAAEFNLPQVYWRAIGTSVGKAIATTYAYNRVYERAIFPLGQLYMNPPTRQVRRFRRLALASGFGGVSWWSWQHASGREWRAVSRRVSAPRKYRPTDAYPTLESGAAGDLVIWAQQHLAAGGYYAERIDGSYDNATREATETFQASVGLLPTGVIDAATWQQLLARLDPLPVTWRKRGLAPGHGDERRGQRMPVPASAGLRPRAHEFPLDRKR